MARTKAFDETEVIDRALAMFWQQGYEATSVRDLLSHAGISSSSLYATFGDKHELFCAALDRYRALEREQFATILADSQAIRPTLNDLYATLIDTLLLDDGSRGSFTLNAAIELGGRDLPVLDRLRHHFDDVCGMLASRLAEAQARGEINAVTPAADLARYLLFGLYSLATMARIYPDRKLLEGMAGMLMAILDC